MRTGVVLAKEFYEAENDRTGAALPLELLRELPLQHEVHVRRREGEPCGPRAEEYHPPRGEEPRLSVQYAIHLGDEGLHESFLRIALRRLLGNEGAHVAVQRVLPLLRAERDRLHDLIVPVSLLLDVLAHVQALAICVPRRVVPLREDHVQLCPEPRQVRERLPQAEVLLQLDRCLVAHGLLAVVELQCERELLYRARRGRQRAAELALIRRYAREALAARPPRLGERRHVQSSAGQHVYPHALFSQEISKAHGKLGLRGLGHEGVLVRGPARATVRVASAPSMAQACNAVIAHFIPDVAHVAPALASLSSTDIPLKSPIKYREGVGQATWLATAP